MFTEESSSSTHHIVAITVRQHHVSLSTKTGSLLPEKHKLISLSLLVWSISPDTDHNMYLYEIETQHHIRLG